MNNPNYFEAGRQSALTSIREVVSSMKKDQGGFYKNIVNDPQEVLIGTSNSGYNEALSDLLLKLDELSK